MGLAIGGCGRSLGPKHLCKKADKDDIQMPFQQRAWQTCAGDASPCHIWAWPWSATIVAMCNYCCYVLTPMWIAHLPLACSLQGYHGVICDNLAGSDWGMAQAGNRAGKTQPCMQMGENELEWVSVTSGNMNVLNSAFIFFGVGSANLWCDASAEWAWLDVSNMNVANPACTHCLDPTCCW